MLPVPASCLPTAACRRIRREGSLRCRTNAYIAGGVPDVGADIFQRGLCLPSDNKLTEEQVDGIIALIHSCFA